MVLVENPLFAQNRDKLIRNRQEIKPFFPEIFVMRFSCFMHEIRAPRLLKLPDFSMS